MAALRYKDEHNKVSYLLKPTESDDYHQIIDFLRVLTQAVTVDSNISPGGASNNLAASTSVPTAVPTGATAVPAGASTIPPGAF
nr:hypothetical protein [Tanacetum cinerariifolium]